MEEESITPTQEQSQSVQTEGEHIPIGNTEEHLLPKWVKNLYRIYAVVIVLGSIAVGIILTHSVITQGKELLATVTDSIVSMSGIVAIFILIFALVFLILEIAYGIGVYKFKRWVLPLVFTFSSSALLIGILSLFNLNFTGIAELIGQLVGMIFMGLVGYVGIKYWSAFTGPSRKLLIQIPLLLIVLPFIVFGTLTQLYSDDPQINDSDLILEPVEALSEFNNAHYSLPKIDVLPAIQSQRYKAALAFARELEEKNLGGIEAMDHVNQTKNLTDDFLTASTKLGYQCPSLINEYGLDVVICSLNDVRSLAVLTSLRAGVEADTGSTDQAITSAVSIIQLGSLLSNAEQPLLIEYLVGVAIMKTGLESMERILNASTSINSQIVVFAISELEKHKVDNSSFANSLRREYMSTKDTSNSFAEFSNYFYLHNKTVNDFAELHRKQISISSLGCNADSTREREQLAQFVEEAQLAPSKWPIISPNFIGKILKSAAFASLNTAYEKGCEVNELNLQVQKMLDNQIVAEQRQEIVNR